MSKRRKASCSFENPMKAHLLVIVSKVSPLFAFGMRASERHPKECRCLRSGLYFQSASKGLKFVRRADLHLFRIQIAWSTASSHRLWEKPEEGGREGGRERKREEETFLHNTSSSTQIVSVKGFSFLVLFHLSSSFFRFDLKRKVVDQKNSEIFMKLSVHHFLK